MESRALQATASTSCSAGRECSGSRNPSIGFCGRAATLSSGCPTSWEILLRQAWRKDLMIILGRGVNQRSRGRLRSTIVRIASSAAEQIEEVTRDLIAASTGIRAPARNENGCPWWPLDDD